GGPTSITSTARFALPIFYIVITPLSGHTTVHAVLPHTALRHRSPSGMRSRVAHRSGEPVDPEVAQPVPREAVRPVEPRERMLPAGQDRHSFMDVVVDGAELVRRVPLPEVGAPTPQHGV